MGVRRWATACCASSRRARARQRTENAVDSKRGDFSGCLCLRVSNASPGAHRASASRSSRAPVLRLPNHPPSIFVARFRSAAPICAHTPGLRCAPSRARRCRLTPASALRQPSYVGGSTQSQSRGGARSTWCHAVFSGSLRAHLACAPALFGDEAGERTAHEAIARPPQRAPCRCGRASNQGVGAASQVAVRHLPRPSGGPPLSLAPTDQGSRAPSGGRQAKTASATVAFQLQAPGVLAPEKAASSAYADESSATRSPSSSLPALQHGNDSWAWVRAGACLRQLTWQPAAREAGRAERSPIPL